MDWGEIELHPDVEAWLLRLPDTAFAQAQRSIDRLAEQGPLLGEPHTRQLHGKLRELRFHLERQQVRITYFVGADRRIVLLTVFRKTRQHERAEIDRAEREMQRCIDAGHTSEED